MAIIGTLPNNIQNGQLEDATPLMADFNFIVNQVNANAGAINAFSAPSGTRMLFNQAAPPVGWTQEVGAAFDDTSVRTVVGGGTGGAVGGTSGWSQWNFGNSINITPFGLSIANLPPHSHPDTGHNHGITDPGHSHTPSSGTAFAVQTGGTATLTGGGTANFVTNTATAATGVSVNIGFATSAVIGSGTNITPNFTTPQVKFSNYIVGIKT